MLYTGKGGVGKTTTAAATAAVAAARGLRVLLASADAAHSLGDVLGQPVGADPVPLPTGAWGAGSLHAVEIDARAELMRRWGAVRGYLTRVLRYRGLDDLVADELALLPGLEELTTLLAVEAWAEEGRFDLLVVDCAPTGSALRLLSLPDTAHGALRILLRLQRAITAVATPLARNLVTLPLPGTEVFREAEDLVYRELRRLRVRIDAPATSVRLVVTPERMVIDETLRARTDLALFDIRCDAVVLNRLLPEAAAIGPIFHAWYARQHRRRATIEHAFSPLPVLAAPLQQDEVLGLERLRAHGAVLFAGSAPEALLWDGPGLCFEETTGPAGPVVEMRLPLPHVRPAELDVAKVDDRLVIHTAGKRRPIPLPRRLASMEIRAARLREGTLSVQFEPRSPQPRGEAMPPPGSGSA